MPAINFIIYYNLFDVIKDRARLVSYVRHDDARILIQSILECKY